jgi:hypothetical protein
MKKLLFLILSFILPASYLFAEDVSANKQFDAFKQRFVLAYLRMNPDQATNMGYHAYDSLLIVPNESNMKSQVDFSTRYLDSLNTFKYEVLKINKSG